MSDYVFQEYPKDLHFEGKDSITVQNEDEERAALEADKPKRGRPAKDEE